MTDLPRHADTPGPGLPAAEQQRVTDWLTGYQAWVAAQQAQATAIRVEATDGH